MKRFWAVAIAVLLLADEHAFAVDKVRMAYVSPSVSLSLPWIAKESGILAKHDLAAEILLITGSPRLVQSLIAGDVDVAFAGITAITRARVRGADVAILGASANVSSQKLMVGRNSKKTDPAVKNFSNADFVDASFFREIEKSGLIEQLYRK